MGRLPEEPDDGRGVLFVSLVPVDSVGDLVGRRENSVPMGADPAIIAPFSPAETIAQDGAVSLPTSLLALTRILSPPRDGEPAFPFPSTRLQTTRGRAGGGGGGGGRGGVVAG